MNGPTGVRVGRQRLEVGTPGPPPVPFVLAVGVTGHRAEVLPDGSVPILRERVGDVLRQIEAAGRRLLEKERTLGSALTFAFFTILTARAATLPQFVLLRFLTGLGLGGAIRAHV